MRLIYLRKRDKEIKKREREIQDDEKTTLVKFDSLKE